MLTKADEGGMRGVQESLIFADVICEQPLSARDVCASKKQNYIFSKGIYSKLCIHLNFNCHYLCVY